MRIVLDTNVLIAAILKKGLSSEIIELAITTNLITLITSEEILSELRSKLLSKLQNQEQVIELYIAKIKEAADVMTIREKVGLGSRDPDDNKILETALSGKADLIVSMDQDLIKLKSFRGIGIVHPKTLTWILPKDFKK